MTSLVATLAVLLLGWLAFGALNVAYGELEEFDGIQGQSHHAHLYKRGRCEACHETKQPTGYPADDACVQCHDLEGLIEATARDSEEEKWQNPHNNLHYGAEVPCVECHGEHSTKESLCADCHNFDYSAKKE
jgi:hypothetical protein